MVDIDDMENVGRNLGDQDDRDRDLGHRELVLECFEPLDSEDEEELLVE